MLESKKRAAIFLLLAFILAAVAGYMVLDKVRSLNAELGGMTSVYVANGNIPSRALLQPSQLTTMEIPNRFVVEGSHITDLSKFENSVLVVPLAKGDIVTEEMIKPASNLMEENNRLVTISRDEIVQFDQVIEALDRVDIIVSREVDGKEMTEIFMRDVPVAYADPEEEFSGIAVEVSIEDAPKLIHMQNYAEKIRILKANVGKGSTPVQQSEEQPTVKEEKKPEEAEKKEETKETKQKSDKEE